MTDKRAPNVALQLRRAISIHAAKKRLLEKKGYRAVSCKPLFGGDQCNQRPLDAFAD
jgi:hypothetical protein